MSLLLALTGGASPANYSLSCAAGSYALSGVAATIKRSKLVTAAAGSYAITGQAATIAKSSGAGAYTLIADAGSYSLTFNSATLARTGGDDVQLLGGTFKREKGSAWDKLLSPPIQHKLEQIEPEAAQEIEAQAVAEVTQPDHSEDQMRDALDRLGIAYKEAYQEIYRELVAEMRQAQEDEQIAQIMAMLL
jgi:hypothetical protein